ncbi:protein POOR HOMOLOGOUS SYNAPSIS 1 isoform X2 [Setaria italica]|uniref:protein POOR HOMOLOGOUS SYNAPSIS 1 isoform X2 n=1 Tax=Setaria italica TaxID=4555 RepID=UPI000BE5CA26|nr:protein POOR HOMOLOGOUS SYNAPSIS 1 isoform X2 [Setaria italica]
MADAGDDSMALVPARPDSSAVETPRTRTRRQKWDVEYARYFGTPRRDPSAPPPPGLRHITRGIHRHQGTWLPASSPAALCVSRPTLSSAVPVLTVSIGDVVFEEHFVSILNFSWPQVMCVTQCPIRGSRVVFMSFCDKSKQKFAVRFPQLCDAESFLNCVKECPCETMDIIPSGSDYVCEDSSASEYIASNGLHHRPDDASSFEEQASDHMIEAPTMSYHEEWDLPVLEPLSANNTNNSYSGFPPSFSQMLTNFSTENEQDAEESYPVGTTNHASQEVYALDTSHDVAPEETTADKGMDVGEGIDTSILTGDIMTRVKTYMADDSFNAQVRAMVLRLVLWEEPGNCDVGQHGRMALKLGKRTQVLNRLEGLLGCGENLNFTLPFLGRRGGHGRAKRAAVPARAGDCTARRRRAVASPIWPCILLWAGELPDGDRKISS